MKRAAVLLFLTVLLQVTVSAQSFAPVLSFIRNTSDIREGGCDLFNYEGQSMLIAVSAVSVGNKSELQCRTVGGAKAKRDMLSFVNGSEITSCIMLKTSESVERSLSGEKVESRQLFTETIKERVIGEINRTVPLGGWYSEDGSVYYFAIYKVIE